MPCRRLLPPGASALKSRGASVPDGRGVLCSLVDAFRRARGRVSTPPDARVPATRRARPTHGSGGGGLAPRCPCVRPFA